ncbi:unnamed protein product [Notodromas monacha]|uniref:Uncharacterized protein n=1 Tax=Notodromas monacha TaxID=399045 RepID=A0A7R9GLV7_9CRUS|nr:unnamed protein product [Notodromas monacha]CAG0926293.1 unnamed protein product [Notodromas monacha]
MLSNRTSSSRMLKKWRHGSRKRNA